MQEINKRLLQSFEVVAIGFHMVSIDVGDDRHHWQQIQERRIGFISFDHHIVAFAQTRVGSGTV